MVPVPPTYHFEHSQHFYSFMWWGIFHLTCPCCSYQLGQSALGLTFPIQPSSRIFLQYMTQVFLRILVQWAPTNSTLSAANPSIWHANLFISGPSPVPTNQHKQIINGNYADLFPYFAFPSSATCGQISLPTCSISTPERDRKHPIIPESLLPQSHGRRSQNGNCFGDNSLYEQHTLFASKNAACLQQFDEDA